MTIQRVIIVYTLYSLLTGIAYAQEPLYEADNASIKAPPYVVEDVEGMGNAQFMQPGVMEAINAATVQTTPGGQQPPAQPPSPPMPPPVQPPLQNPPPTPTTLMNPPPRPDTTTEPAGCTGPASDSKCVTYYGDTRTIRYHEENVLSQAPTNGQNEVVDRNVFERWNYATSNWDTEWNDVNTHRHTWAIGDLDPFSGQRSWENTHDFKYEFFHEDSATASFGYEWGTVDITVVDQNNRTIRDDKYSYHGPPLNRTGYQSSFKYDAQGRMNYSERTDLSGNSSTKIVRSDANADGTMETCNETITQDGTVVYQGVCVSQMLLA